MTSAGGATLNLPGRTAPTCIMASQALDRAAYQRLFDQELNWPVAIESDFTPVSVWTVLRARPALVIAICDTATREVSDALQMVQRLHRDARILGVAGALTEPQLELWSRCPVHGLITKDAAIAELLASVQAVSEGQTRIAPAIANAMERARQNPDGLVKLSRREEELLPLLARGLTLRDAASVMNVSYKTADSYRSHLLKKLELRDRVDLVRYAIRKGIIEP